MNLARRSIVRTYKKGSVEYSIVQDICYNEDKGNTMAKETSNLSTYIEVLRNVSLLNKEYQMQSNLSKDIPRKNIRY